VYDSKPLPGGSHDLQDHESWHELIESYSSKSFSFTTDRLAAIAGITDWYQVRTGRTPILGLWKESIVQDLSWGIYTGQAVLRFPIPGLPSWTWLFWDSNILFEMHPFSEYHSSYDLQVLDCSVDWFGKPMTSNIKTSTLKVRGLLKTVKLSLYRVAERASPGSLHSRRFIIETCPIEPDYFNGTSFDRFGGEEITPENALKFLPDQSVECLLLMYRYERSELERYPSRHYLTFLLLERLSDGEEYPIYRRIGIGRLGTAFKNEDEPVPIFSGVEPTSLELV